MSDEEEGTEKCRLKLDPEMIVPSVPLTLTTQEFGITTSDEIEHSPWGNATSAIEPWLHCVTIVLLSEEQPTIVRRATYRRSLPVTFPASHATRLVSSPQPHVGISSSGVLVAMSEA